MNCWVDSGDCNGDLLTHKGNVQFCEECKSASLLRNKHSRLKRALKELALEAPFPEFDIKYEHRKVIIENAGLILKSVRNRIMEVEFEEEIGIEKEEEIFLTDLEEIKCVFEEIVSSA